MGQEQGGGGALHMAHRVRREAQESLVFLPWWPTLGSAWRLLSCTD